MRKQNIKESLRRHYDCLVEYMGGERYIIGLFLVGSQNYGTDTEFSDVDTKAIVLPRLEDVIYNKPAISTTIYVRKPVDPITDIMEQITVVDVRLLMERVKKQNINYLEIFFTDYFILNEDYADLWSKLVENRESLAHYMPYRIAAATAGAFRNKTKEITHKKLSELFRLRDFLYKYIVKKSTFEEALHPNDIDFVKTVKLGEKYEEALFHIVAEPLVEEIDMLMETAKAIEVDKKARDLTEWLSIKFPYEVMTRYLERELKREAELKELEENNDY